MHCCPILELHLGIARLSGTVRSLRRPETKIQIPCVFRFLLHMRNILDIINLSITVTRLWVITWSWCMIAWCWSMIGGCWSMVAWLWSMVTWSWSMVAWFMVGRWLCACAEFLPHSFWHLRDYLAWDLNALLDGDCLADLLWDFLFHLTNCFNKGIMGGGHTVSPVWDLLCRQS